MARIYKRSDRIKVKIDDVIVTIAPLSLHHKMYAEGMLSNGRAKKDIHMLTDGLISILRNSVKDISGLEDADGNPYKLVFEDDVLSKECVDDLFNIEIHKKLTMICSNLVGAIPSQFTDNEGKPIEGVEILNSSKEASDPK